MLPRQYIKAPKDLTNLRFTRLTVLHRGSVRAYPCGGKMSFWVCKCDCGVVKEVSRSDLLKTPGTTSCGCRNRERSAGGIGYIDGRSKTLRRALTAYQSNARKAGRSFTITQDQAFKLMNSDCNYCGAHPVPDAKGIIRNGIDRIDNSRGYTDDNCVPCCSICNRLKSAIPVNEFLNQIQKISDYQVNKGN